VGGWCDLLCGRFEVEDVERMRRLLEIALLKGVGQTGNEREQWTAGNELQEGATIGHARDYIERSPHRGIGVVLSCAPRASTLPMPQAPPAHSSRRPEPAHVLIVALGLSVFFASGFAALVYQVVWQRLLAMFSGADVYSATLIVAAFMAGLGLGHLAGGHVADRVSARTSLLCFAGAELAIGTFGLWSASLYYEVLYQRLGHFDLGPAGTAGVLFVSLLWPTFFMGASLPLLSRTLAQRIERAGGIIGSLYAVNTVGAAGGAFLATWWLLPAWGLDGTLRIGAILNLACAAVLLPLGMLLHDSPAGATLQTGTSEPEAAPPASPIRYPGDVSFEPRTWYLLYALAGLFALSIEIVWFRILGVMMKSTAFTFGTLLTLYLAGIGGGALAGSAIVSRIKRPGLVFLQLQTAAAITVGGSLAALAAAANDTLWLWEYFGGYEPLHVGDGIASLQDGNRSLRGRFLTLYFAIPALLVLPVTLLMGASFPMLQKAVQTDVHRIGRRVGQLLLANIAGSLTGCVVTGWLLLDYAGAAGTVKVLIAGSGIFLWLVFRQATRSLQMAGAARLAIALGATVVMTGAMVAATPESSRLWGRLHGSDRPDLIVHEDGSGVSAIRRIGGQAVVFVNGVGQSHLPYGNVHTALGALPAFVHPNPRTAAIIGLGSGDTAWAAAGRLDLDRVVTVEIVQPQLRTLRRLHETWRYGGLTALLTDPRIEQVFGDGRTFLLRGGRRFDLIEADALRPSSAYSGNLYSEGYFTLVRERLTPGGLAATWAPTERVLNTFVRVFPHVLAVPGILIGSNDPIPFDPATIIERAGHPAVVQYYKAGGVDIVSLLEDGLRPPRVFTPEFDRTTLVDYNTDLFPRDEYDLRPRPR
jgi:spermidine synthase